MPVAKHGLQGRVGDHRIDAARVLIRGLALEESEAENCLLGTIPFMEAIMTNRADSPVSAHNLESGVARRSWLRTTASVVGASAIMAATIGPAAITAGIPAAGDVYVYRQVNGYNNEVRAQVRYRVDKLESDRVTVSVTMHGPSGEAAYTEIYTREGNWLRHPLVNHNQMVEYEFAAAYPAYAFPLAPGKSWSVRVNATVPATGQLRSVRIDGAVLGNERIRVPAGEFDTVKIRRLVYSGDWESFLTETTVMEFDWYAPALGRTVRTERKAEFLDLSRGRGNRLQHGDWDVFELVEAPAAKT